MIDMNEYISYIYEPKTILVNKDHPLGIYVPQGLISLNSIACRTVSGRELLLVRCAALSLKAMMDKMMKDDPSTYKLIVTSAYRSYEYQEKLYEKYVAEYMSSGMSREDAQAEVSKTSARPGESEHQSGLCVDFIIEGERSLDISFDRTSAFKWLSKNAHLFGFILRYPKGKENITKYEYEPWHYRFVGRDAATAIYNERSCLEEYIDTISQI